MLFAPRPSYFTMGGSSDQPCSSLKSSFRTPQASCPASEAGQQVDIPVWLSDLGEDLGLLRIEVFLRNESTVEQCLQLAESAR